MGEKPTYAHALIYKSVIPAGIAGIHDCWDAGGRATQEQVSRLHGHFELAILSTGYLLPGGYDGIYV
jgi:hypothetical protein